MIDRTGEVFRVSPSWELRGEIMNTFARGRRHIPTCTLVIVEDGERPFVVLDSGELMLLSESIGTYLEEGAIVPTSSSPWWRKNA